MRENGAKTEEGARYFTSPVLSCGGVTAITQPLGLVAVELESRFEAIRTRETTMGNFMCDIFNTAMGGEVCLMNSGTFRSDRVCLRVCVYLFILFFVSCARII